MPIIWMGFSVATSPDIDKWKSDPTAVKRYVQGVAEAAGGELVEVYYEVNRDRACALITGLDDFVNIRSVARIFGADEATKLLTVDQALDGFGRESGFREAGDTNAGSPGG
jgi:hypothetical protein